MKDMITETLEEAAALERRCRERLAESCVPMAFKLANKSFKTGQRWPRGTERGDVEGAAMLGLARAAAGYRPDLGNRFTTVAHTYIAMELLKTHAAAWEAVDRGVWRQASGDLPDGTPRKSLPERVADPRPGPESSVDWADWLEATLALIPCPKRREVFRRHHILGVLQKDIAAEMGVSQQRVRQLVESAMSAARRCGGAKVKGGGRLNNDGKKSRFRALYRQGVPVRDICATVGIAKDTANQWRKSMGLEGRRARA